MDEDLIVEKGLVGLKVEVAANGGVDVEALLNAFVVVTLGSTK